MVAQTTHKDCKTRYWTYSADSLPLSLIHRLLTHILTPSQWDENVCLYINANDS